MADNITAPASGAVLATDDVGGVQYPRVKVTFGVDGSAVDASATNPLPVTFAGGLAVTGTFWQATQPISAASLPLPAGASTAALQTTMNTSLGTLATSAAQTTGNTSLASIATNTAGLATQATAAAMLTALTDPTVAKVDTVVQSAAVDRGLIIGFAGTATAASSASTTLTVTVPTTQGVPAVGQAIAGPGIPAGTTITAVSGTAPSYSLTLSAAATVASGAAVTGNPGSLSFMPLNTARRGWSIRNLSATATVYINGLGAATADYHSLPIKPGEFYDTKDSHVGTSALTIISDIGGGAAMYAREW